MLRKTLLYATMVAMLSCSSGIQTVKKSDDVRKDIRSLELRIVERNIWSYDKQESDRFITYEDKVVCVDKTNIASVKIIYDKETKDYRYFEINVRSRYFTGRPTKGVRTIEHYFDEGLDGYDPQTPQQADRFSRIVFRKDQRTAEDNLFSMNKKEIDRVNLLFRERLMQIEKGCIY